MLTEPYRFIPLKYIIIIIIIHATSFTTSNTVPNRVNLDRLRRRRTVICIIIDHRFHVRAARRSVYTLMTKHKFRKLRYLSLTTSNIYIIYSRKLLNVWTINSSLPSSDRNALLFAPISSPPPIIPIKYSWNHCILLC